MEKKLTNESISLENVLLQNLLEMLKFLFFFLLHRFYTDGFITTVQIYTCAYWPTEAWIGILNQIQGRIKTLSSQFLYVALLNFSCSIEGKSIKRQKWKISCIGKSAKCFQHRWRSPDGEYFITKMNSTNKLMMKYKNISTTTKLILYKRKINIFLYYERLWTTPKVDHRVCLVENHEQHICLTAEHPLYPTGYPSSSLLLWPTLVLKSLSRTMESPGDVCPTNLLLGNHSPKQQSKPYSQSQHYVCTQPCRKCDTALSLHVPGSTRNTLKLGHFICRYSKWWCLLLSSAKRHITASARHQHVAV